MASIYETAVATNLNQEFLRIQQELKDVENNLRKLTGREIPSRERDSRREPRRSDGDNGARRKRNLNSRDLAEEVDDEPPRKLQSSVIATSRLKPRESALEEQKNDEKSLARNRRMFGMILGTLQKFQSDESRRKPTLQQREAIEKKVEKEAEEEKANVKRERQELFKSRRQKQAEIRRLQLKMERVEIHQEWEKSQLLMGSFIQTKTKPCIFYIPKKFTPETEKRRKDTKDKYRMIIAEKRVKVQKELNEIDESYKREEDIDEYEDEMAAENLPSSDSHCKDACSDYSNAVKNDVELELEKPEPSLDFEPNYDE